MRSTPARFRASVLLAVLGTSSLALPAQAEVLFRGDMETGDLKQWSYLLKEEGLSVVTDIVAEGKYAAKVTISNKELWTNGLNRVEVQHKPDNAYLTEGKEIYYGFSFYLPAKLTAANHQILYWETTETYQQVLQLAVEGERMRFATQKPSWKVHWEADGKATAGKWHRIVLHIKWSANADMGQVDLWFNGEQVVTAGKAQTFLGTPAFAQHGILRDTIADVETLYFDDARAGTTLEDVLMPAPMGGGGTGGGGAGGQSSGGAPSGGQSSGGAPSAGAPSGGAAASGGAPVAGGAPSGGGGTTAGAPSSAGTPSGTGGAPASAGAASGGAPSGGTVTPPTPVTGATPSEESGCAFAPRPSGGAAALAALLGLFALRRRRS
jgi:MYXO-CTERM domain-containing protein